MILSIVIPVYNAVGFLEDTLEHLLEQVNESTEIILVDDGSIDGSDKICATYSKSYSFISSLLLPHGGVSIARNKGLELVKGKFVYFFDSDDRLVPDSLNFFSSMIEKNTNAEVFTFPWKTLNEDGVEKYYLNNGLPENYFENGEEFFKLFLTRKVECNNCNIIYSLAFINKMSLRFTEGATRGEDVEFFIKAFSYARSIYYSNRISFIYMIRTGSTTQAYKTYPAATLESLVRNLIVLNTIKEDHHSIKDEIRFYMASLYIAHLYYYLKSKDCYCEAENKFLQNKGLIGKQRKFHYPHSVVMWVVKLLPLRLLFKLKKCFQGGI